MTDNSFKLRIICNTILPSNFFNSAERYLLELFDFSLEETDDGQGLFVYSDGIKKDSIEDIVLDKKDQEDLLLALTAVYVNLPAHHPFNLLISRLKKGNDDLCLNDIVFWPSVVQGALKRHPEMNRLSFEYAMMSPTPQLNACGGGCWRITAQDIELMTTTEWTAETISIVDAEERPTTDLSEKIKNYLIGFRDSTFTGIIFGMILGFIIF